MTFNMSYNLLAFIYKIMRNKGEFLLIALFLMCLFLTDSLSPVCEACHFIVNEAKKSMPKRPFDILLSNIGLQYCQKKHI